MPRQGRNAAAQPPDPSKTKKKEAKVKRNLSSKADDSPQSSGVLDDDPARNANEITTRQKVKKQNGEHPTTNRKAMETPDKPGGSEKKNQQAFNAVAPTPQSTPPVVEEISKSLQAKEPTVDNPVSDTAEIRTPTTFDELVSLVQQMKVQDNKKWQDQKKVNDELRTRLEYLESGLFPIRRRFFQAFAKRLNMEPDHKQVFAGNLAAHHPLPRVDTLLFLKDPRPDPDLYVRLYGFNPEDLQTVLSYRSGVRAMEAYGRAEIQRARSI